MSRRYSIPAHDLANELHFDYLTLTFSIDKVAEFFGYSLDNIVETENVPNGVWGDLQDYLGLEQLVFAERKHGIYTYECSEKTANDSIIVGYNREYYREQDSYFGDKNTIMIQVSGEGIKTLNAVFDSQNSNLFDFIETAIKIGGKCTRCDLAMDWFNYKWQRSPLHVYRKIRKHEIKSTFRYWKWMASGSVIDAYDRDDPRRYNSSKEGTTLYFGHNPKQLRIYNKKAEREYVANQDFDVDSWYRWEFQLNDPYAEQAIELFLKYRQDDKADALQRVYFGILRDNLTILSRGNDSNKSRWKPTKWYSEMLKNYDKVHLRYEHEKPTLEKKRKFLDKKMANSIATVLMGDIQDLMKKDSSLSQEDAYKQATTAFLNSVFDDGKIDQSAISAYLIEQDNKLKVQDRKQDLLRAVNKIQSNKSK